MAQTKSVISGLLAQAGTQPKHRFGQNFMVDQNLVRVIAESGSPKAGDLVVEVGPGTGTLTETILESGAEVVAVEIDRDLAGLLRERLGGREGGREGFSLIEGDALDGKHAVNAELAGRIRAARGEGRAVKLIANLPYNIASPLIVELLLEGVGMLAFTVQKEVAERLKARHGEEAYGPLSVTTQMLSRVEVLRTLPPQAFWPPPKIDSALVRLTAENRLGGMGETERARAFSTFVQQVFSARRKMLRKSLGMVTEDVEGLLARVGVEGTRRCEELSPEVLLEMFRVVRGEV